LELYNGWGYRKIGSVTPYLWSFSNLYVKGKFVRDGVLDPEVISKQTGAAVILKRMLEKGGLTLADLDLNRSPDCGGFIDSTGGVPVFK
jgi:lysozyme family protein